MMITMILNPTPAMITNAALAYQYNDIKSLTDLHDYAINEMMRDIDPTNRTAIIELIDTDLADMLHNNNLDFYAPLAELDTLTESQFIYLAEYLDETIDAALIADALIAKLTQL